MSILSIQLFGHFSAAYNGVALTTLNTPRLQALFAYLILNQNTSIFRYHLAYLFWPDSNESQARTNLRNLIHLLRQALPDFDRFIHSNTQTLQWLEDAPFRLDVHDFTQLLADSSDSSLAQEKLERAVALYQGDLLPECYDDWIIPQRERLRQNYLSAIKDLAGMTESSRDYPAALQVTRRLVQEEPLDSDANCQLIRLYALTGNQPAALKAYQAYAALLESELGIQPDQETRDLYTRLKKLIKPENPVSDRFTHVDLVGRQGEWARLQATWRRSVAGSPQAVFVTGEAGIGKTRLVEEFLQWASRQGLRTVVANCYPAEGSLPYAPVVSWLRSRALPRLENIWLAEISRLLPEVLNDHPKLASPQPLTESWQRQRLFEALARAVLGEPQALLLVIEDIHWCDQDTLEWLHYLLRYKAKSPFLIVATERSEETVAVDDPLKKMQAALASEEKYTEIKLKALNEAECVQLAVRVAEEGSHQVLRPEYTANIYRETEGNPLYIVEMVRLGNLPQTQALLPGETVSFLGKVQTVLKRRIDQLSAPTRELASLAATLGREFRLDVLLQASGLREEDLVKALNELLQRQIVHEQTPDQYDFTHDKLRQAVFSGLSSAHQRLLHRRTAEAYLHLAGDAPQSRSAEIASHYEAAGMVLPAIQYFSLASESAAHLFSTADAIRNVARAIELAKTAGVGEASGIPADEFAGLMEKMADLLALEGKFQQAQSCFEQAMTQSLSPSGLWRSKIYRKLSDVMVSQYQHGQAHIALNQAEQALQYSGDGGALMEKQEWLQIQLARIQLFYWQNYPDQMEELFQKVASTVEADGRIDQKITFLSLQYMLRLQRECYRLSKETVAIGRRRLDLAEKLNEPSDLAIAQFQFGFGLLWYGDLAAAREWLSIAYAATERVGARLWQVRCLAYLGVASRKLNDLASLRQQTRELLELAPAMQEYAYHGIGLANLGWLAWRDGDMIKAEQWCNEAVEVWSKFGRDVFHGLANWVLLAVAISQHNLIQAKNYALTLLDSNPKYQPVEESISRLLSQALCACQAQEVDAAFTLFNQALEKAQVAGEL